MSVWLGRGRGGGRERGGVLYSDFPGGSCIMTGFIDIFPGVRCLGWEAMKTNRGESFSLTAARHDD